MSTAEMVNIYTFLQQDPVKLTFRWICIFYRSTGIILIANTIMSYHIYAHHCILTPNGHVFMDRKLIIFAILITIRAYKKRR